MPSLTGNIENRVRKLAKPSNAAQALQPVFEAISNGFFAVEDRFKEEAKSSGTLNIRVTGIKDLSSIVIEISDNGIGLDDAHFNAFLTVDTDFKADKGGKGVGRLYWLDAFQEIYVESAFSDGWQIKRRSFKFDLAKEEQVVAVESENLLTSSATGTVIRFRGIRSKEYARFFPNNSEQFHRYFAAHFIADFLLDSSSNVNLDVDGERETYPSRISALVVGPTLGPTVTDTDAFGQLSITGFACDPLASFGLDGQHQLHLLANGRTVESRKVDNLLGLPSVERLGRSGLVFHGCVSGDFLDTRVNEGRTGFNLSDADLKKISRLCMDFVKAQFFPEQILKFSLVREERYESFVARHPIYGFDDTATQLSRVPFHALKAEDFAAGLVKYQIRREEERQKALNVILDTLESGAALPKDFGASMIKAAEGVQASERLALAQHVVRRKLVLEIMERLLSRARVKTNGQNDNFLEETLHTLICPMKVRGDDPTENRSRAHDLWIVDERLAFTRAFASDARLDQIVANAGTGQRPDLVVWDYAVGMAVADPATNGDSVDISKPLDKIMVVEFKKPGREDYPLAKDQVEQQIIKYLGQLQGEEIKSFDGRPIRVAKDCIFYCYIIADIVGDLKQQLSGWETVANGQGRIRPLKGQYAGFIEVVQWQDLVNDAWGRNQALLFAAGLKRGNSIDLIDDNSDATNPDEPSDDH